MSLKTQLWREGAIAREFPFLYVAYVGFRTVVARIIGSPTLRSYHVWAAASRNPQAISQEPARKCREFFRLFLRTGYYAGLAVARQSTLASADLAS